MKQVEIEFKTLLSAEKYRELCEYYQLNEDAFHTQTNVYFDTPTHDLQTLKCGLRIRQYADYGEITLKTPQTVGLLETTDPLTLEECQNYIASQSIPKKEVYQTLLDLGVVPEKLAVIAELTTKRAEFPINEGLLALDESWYNQQHDYELELEVNDHKKGKIAFESYLNQFNIPYSPAKNKIVRAIQTK